MDQSSRLRTALLLVCGACVVVVNAASAANDAPRHALVIGNSQYKSSPLPNASNDARAISKTLNAVGFRVRSLENASQKQMMEAIRAFGDDIKGGSVGLFYFAGHGIQVKGRNFLIPSDANITREDEIPYQSVDAGQVLDKMESAKNSVNIMILDACRNNPFARSSRSSTVGLAQMDAPVGTLIAFATAPGAEASDGLGDHGVYTENMLKHMTQPGLKIEDLFKRVRVGVRNDTKNKQIPWENTSLEGDFYFVPPAPGSTNAATGSSPSAPTPTDPKAIEVTFWNSIKDSSRPGDYQAYMERYPKGEFASLARGRITDLQKQNEDHARTVVNLAPATPPDKPAAQPGRQTFSFAAAEQQTERDATARRDESSAALSGACAPARKRAGIRIEVEEQMGRKLTASMARPMGVTATGISDRLRRAGLTIDPGGKAQYVLRGVVSSNAGTNRLVRVNEISISAALDLFDASGRLVGNFLSREESYAGADLMFAYRDLAQRQAEELAGRIYRDFCSAN
ncbi:MAG: caspase domain-containing protein [Burkholderiales bacterium]